MDFFGRLILGLAAFAVVLSVAQTSAFRLPASVAGAVLVVLIVGVIVGGERSMGGLIRLIGGGALAYMLISELGMGRGLGDLLVFILIFGAFYVMLHPFLRREGQR